MMSKKISVGLAIVAGMVAVFLGWRQFSGPSVNLRPSGAAGEVLAEEVARVLGGAGKVVLLSRQPPPAGPDANRERVTAFEAALKRHPQLTLAAPEWLPAPPAGMMDLGVVTTDQLLAALEKNPQANAFVIFAGLPPFSRALGDKLTARSAKVIAVCGYTADVRRWLESKVLAVAIVPRFDDFPKGAPAPKTARDWLEREYELLTPETLARAPY